MGLELARYSSPSAAAANEGMYNMLGEVHIDRILRPIRVAMPMPGGLAVAEPCCQTRGWRWSEVSSRSV